jgi:hypothetical protein
MRHEYELTYGLINNNTIFDGVVINETNVISLQTLLTFWVLDLQNDEIASRPSATERLLGFLRKPEQVAQRESDLTLRTECLKTTNISLEIQFDRFVCSDQID